MLEYFLGNMEIGMGQSGKCLGKVDQITFRSLLQYANGAGYRQAPPKRLAATFHFTQKQGICLELPGQDDCLRFTRIKDIFQFSMVGGFDLGPWRQCGCPEFAGYRSLRMSQFRQDRTGNNHPVIKLGKYPNGFDEDQVAERPVSATTRIISLEAKPTTAGQFANRAE